VILPHLLSAEILMVLSRIFEIRNDENCAVRGNFRSNVSFKYFVLEKIVASLSNFWEIWT